MGEYNFILGNIHVFVKLIVNKYKKRSGFHDYTCVIDFF